MSDKPVGSNSCSSATQALVAAIPKITRYISSKVDKQADVDDIVQETLSRTLRSAELKRLDSPLAYALRVAKSALYDHWHQASRHPTETLDEHLLCGGSDLEARELDSRKLDDLIEVLDAMPPLRREVFKRRRVEGQSREQIANELGLSLESVKKHINRALVDITLAMETRGW